MSAVAPLLEAIDRRQARDAAMDALLDARADGDRLTAELRALVALLSRRTEIERVLAAMMIELAAEGLLTRARLERVAALYFAELVTSTLDKAGI